MSEYYQKRHCENCNYEESYWGTIVDPDGCIRNRSQEREKFLANVKKETAFINSLPPSKILDVGCGLGFLLSAIDDKHSKYGLELSSLAAENAEKFAQIYRQKLEESDFNENSFDVVISHHVIEHIETPEIFLKKIKAILKPDGILILSTPDFKSVCAELFGENYRMFHDKTHISLFDFYSLKQMLQDFKFEIKEVDFPYFDTEYFTQENILRVLDYDKGTISPPCWGNFMTFYCKNEK